MKKELLRKFELYLPAGEPIINEYKRQDVFVCSHESHNHFKDTVSVYHVLKKKGCFPDGCINFLWKCKRLEKGLSCKRKFKHVGRNCSNCKFFYDVKLIKKPKIVLTDEKFAEFKKKIKRFEEWAAINSRRFTEFVGTINSVKPHFNLKVDSDRRSLGFQGFLLNFSKGSFDADVFNDFIYIVVSPGMQKKFCFAKGDVISCFGNIDFEKGSLVLRNIRDIDIIDRGEPCYWNESRARSVQRTGAVLNTQSEKCYECDRGSLLFIESNDCEKSRQKRVMYCFNGCVDPAFCFYHLNRSLKIEKNPENPLL